VVFGTPDVRATEPYEAPGFLSAALTSANCVSPCFCWERAGLRQFQHHEVKAIPALQTLAVEAHLLAVWQRQSRRSKRWRETKLLTIHSPARSAAAQGLSETQTGQTWQKVEKSPG